MLKWLGCAYCLLTMLVTLLWHSTQSGSSFIDVAPTMCGVCVISTTLLFLHLQWNHGGLQLLNPFFFIATISLCYSFGWVVPYSWGLIPYSQTVIFAPDKMIDAMSVVTVSHLSFCAGGFLFARQTRSTIDLGSVDLRWLSWLFSALAAMAVVVFLATNQVDVLREQYSGRMTGEYGSITSYAFLLTETLYYLTGWCVVVTVLSGRLRVLAVIGPVVLLGLTSLAFFYMGRRTPIFTMAAICGFTLYYVAPRLNRLGVVLPAAAVLLFLSPLMVIFRTSDKSNETLAVIAENIVERPALYLPTTQAGAQITMVNRAVAVLPSHHSYSFGANFVANAINAVPFSGMVSRATGVALPETTSAFLHATTYPRYNVIQHGLGGHFYADCYHAFGMLGVIVLPMIAAWALGNIHLRARDSVMWLLIATAVFGVSFVEFRNSLVGAWLKNAGWAVLVFWAAAKVTMLDLSQLRRQNPGVASFASAQQENG